MTSRCSAAIQASRQNITPYAPTTQWSRKPRAQLAEARSRTQEKKIRDRRLYRVWEVMEVHGYEDPEDVRELMRTIGETHAYIETPGSPMPES